MASPGTKGNEAHDLTALVVKALSIYRILCEQTGKITSSAIRPRSVPQKERPVNGAAATSRRPVTVRSQTVAKG